MDLSTLILGSNGALALTILYLIREVHSLRAKVEKLAEDAAYYRGVIKMSRERERVA